MSDVEIWRTLNNHVKTFVFNDGLEVINCADDATPRRLKFTGERFEQNVRSSFLHPMLMPRKPLHPIEGSARIVQRVGLYVVRCFRPEAFGEEALIALTEALTRHFFPGRNGQRELTLDVADGSYSVRIIEEPAQQPIGDSPAGGFIGANVLVDYFAFIPRLS